MSAVASKAPTNPFGPSPQRRPGSIRRTSSLETQWPEGFGKPMRIVGRARDLLTDARGEARVLAEDTLEILASGARQILSIETSRSREAAQALVGQRGGGYLRGEIARVLPQEHAGGTPLHLLLDDFSGASLVAGWAWSQWIDPADRLRMMSRMDAGGSERKVVMEGVCWGFQPGSSALTGEGGPNLATQSATRVPPLAREDDPIGWHALTDQQGVGMRRARRLDVWREDGAIRLDIGFQDSATTPDGGWRSAIHEYHVTATIDPTTWRLASLTPDPRILPYRECPGAVANVQRLVGGDVREFRLAVPEQLHGTAGCTHLNDVMRSITDAPRLARQLGEALG